MSRRDVGSRIIEAGRQENKQIQHCATKDIQLYNN